MLNPDMGIVFSSVLPLTRHLLPFSFKESLRGIIFAYFKLQYAGVSGKQDFFFRNATNQFYALAPVMC
jgi:hypothetical protein